MCGSCYALAFCEPCAIHMLNLSIQAFHFTGLPLLVLQTKSLFSLSLSFFLPFFLSFMVTICAKMLSYTHSALFVITYI